MSVIIVGNTSEIASVQHLAAKLLSFIDAADIATYRVEDMVPDSGLHMHFEQVSKSLNNAHVSVVSLDATFDREFIINVRNNLKNGQVIESVTILSDNLDSANSIFAEYLLKLNIPMLSGRREKDIVVEFNNFDFKTALDNVSSDVVVFEGAEIFVRDKYAIKPAQPGKESILKFTALPETITVIVSRINKNVEQTRLYHLKEVIASNPLFSIDENDNICVKI